MGAGDVAERKARLLLDAGATLTVNALTFTPQFQIWADEGKVRLLRGEFSPLLVDEKWLVVAATDSDLVNQEVSEAAEHRRVFCNVVDAPESASVIMPSIIDRSPLMIAVSSGGNAPVLARLLRERLESICRNIWASWRRWRADCGRGSKRIFLTPLSAAAGGKNCSIIIVWHSHWRITTTRKAATISTQCSASRWISMAK